MEIIEDKLKPCPFCGSKPSLQDYGSDGKFVGCNVCGCMTNLWEKENDCINVWNTRASDWIKTKDEMPPHQEDVIIFTPGIGVDFGYFDTNINQWRIIYYDTWEDKNIITRWQPLPAPPEEECQ